MFKKICFILLSFCVTINAQKDSIIDSTKTEIQLTGFIAPAALIAIGMYGLHNEPFKKWDVDLNNSLSKEGQQTSIDDYIYLVPGIAVYGLDLMGVEPKNNVLDRSLQLGASLGLMYVGVKTMKRTIGRKRPDGLGNSAFPSGHTAFAFVLAEFAHQELGHISYWYSIGAYSIATTTAYLRLYNNKHWFTDVIAGAGIGMFLTKLVYYAYPKLKNLIFKPSIDNESVRFSFSPQLVENKIGAGFNLTF
ncbi:hypothetical protein AAU57_09845 [Nonlabens sp. YIK11]|nr:hypothetical protein AAU57_09845 [Nonlabens sp. YIK11]